MRATIGAENLSALFAACPCFIIGFGRPAEEIIFLLLYLDAYAKGRAGELLAIGTVTDADRVLIGHGHIGDCAAMAASIDFHKIIPSV
jgi:hypothetical protein